MEIRAELRTGEALKVMPYKGAGGRGKDDVIIRNGSSVEKTLCFSTPLCCAPTKSKTAGGMSVYGRGMNEQQDDLS